MIGQKKNLELIKNWRINRSFPRFMLIVGDKGSGRFTLSKIIAEQTNSIIYEADNSIDSVREVIKTCYSVKNSTLYIFKDCDSMSLAAKNSMLKVVEEPPNNARFIMTVRDTANVLPTIISRATVIHMTPYTAEELQADDRDNPISYMIKTITDTTDERKTAIYKASELSENVIVHLSNKSMTGVLRELTKLQTKDEDNGVEPDLFIRAFRYQIRNSNIPSSAISMFMPHIVKCCNELRRVSINKRASVEVTMVNIVEAYKEYSVRGD